MGHGEVDSSNEFLRREQASLNTTARLANESGDIAVHVGDISYAEGFQGSVSLNSVFSLVRSFIVIYLSVYTTCLSITLYVLYLFTRLFT